MSEGEMVSTMSFTQLINHRAGHPCPTAVPSLTKIRPAPGCGRAKPG